MKPLKEYFKQKKLSEMTELEIKEEITMNKYMMAFLTVIWMFFVFGESIKQVLWKTGDMYFLLGFSALTFNTLILFLITNLFSKTELRFRKIEAAK